MKTELLQAIDAVLAGDWDRAHHLVQRHESDELACWLHAVLHKMEGDAGNSRYWYAHTGHRFEDFAEVNDELRAIRAEIGAG